MAADLCHNGTLNSSANRITNVQSNLSWDPQHEMTGWHLPLDTELKIACKANPMSNYSIKVFRPVSTMKQHKNEELAAKDPMSSVAEDQIQFQDTRFFTTFVLGRS
ncbi:hypothetical protein PV326_007496, partial [Microctonus aethiopoides]